MSDERQRRLLWLELDRLIETAKVDGTPLRGGYHAGILIARFADAGISLGQILEELVARAGRAGVSVRMGRQDS